MYQIDKLNKKVAEGKFLLGSHVFCGDPMLTEAMAMSGFDMLWIDMEHTAINKERLLGNLIAARSGGTPAFVRVEWTDMTVVKPVIDMGPDGIIFPYIRTVDDARRAVELCEYPPKGIRGYGPLRALDYGAIPQIDFVDREYRKMWRIIQIEHIDAVNNLEAICDVEGIDAFIVGPNDLSGSVGHIGRVTHPDMMPIYDRLSAILRERGKLFGVSMGYVPEVLEQWIARGARMLFCGHDVAYVQEGARAVRAELGGLVGE